MKAQIHVMPKKGILDPQGKAVLRSLQSMGFKEIQDVKVGRYVEVVFEEVPGIDSKARIEEMCKELIANTVIEDFSFTITA